MGVSVREKDVGDNVGENDFFFFYRPSNELSAISRVQFRSWSQ